MQQFDLSAFVEGKLNPCPRILLIAPHPDDEVIGAGTRLPYWRDNIIIAHVTDGSPPNLIDASEDGFSTCQEYARHRRLELSRALKLAGIGPAQLRELQ